MYKHLIFIFFTLLLSLSGIAKLPAGNNTLIGKVKDAAGAVLQGAVVEIPDLKVGTVTDSNGNYVIENLPKGKFIVVASLISYSKAIATISITCR